jgi:enamine deaminase RidA (YjgF/YER057c/UK114 family)
MRLIASVYFREDATMTTLLRVIQFSAILMLGIVVGIAVHSGWTDSPSAMAQAKAGGAEQRLRDRGLELPVVTKPTNTLVNAVRVGDMLYVSGTGPGSMDGKPIVGQLGRDYDVAQGRKASRLVGLQVLAVVKAELGSLDKVERLVKTFGMVNATGDFKEHPQVINGFSDLMVEVFGDQAGKGARSAVGMVSLPSGIPVEIEAIFQVRR